jgi:organic hydroperoxide reductase OsmC/OhrA
MSEHRATISWKRSSADFTYESYNRDHTWQVPGGGAIAASSAPEYRGSPDLIDPEQALVAALSSCHMLTFLAICARKRIIVDAYVDEAVGTMTKNAKGKLFVSHCTLRPRIAWGGTAPSADEIESLHHLSHEECFIANSVLTEITVEAA